MLFSFLKIVTANSDLPDIMSVVSPLSRNIDIPVVHLVRRSSELPPKETTLINVNNALSVQENMTNIEEKFEPFKIKSSEVTVASSSSCMRTRQGGSQVTDSNGIVCNRDELDQNKCCPLRAGDSFSCNTCDASTKCCSVYEYCVSCCVRPAHRKELEHLREHSTHKSIKTGSWFEVCQFKCRTSSGSVVHENSYRNTKVQSTLFSKRTCLTKL